MVISLGVPIAIGQRKERDGLRLSSAVPKIQLDSNPPLPLQLLGYGKPLPLPFYPIVRLFMVFEMIHIHITLF